MKTLTKIFALGSMALGALMLSVTANAVVCPATDAGNQLDLYNVAGGTPVCAGAWDAPSENQVTFFNDLNLLWKDNFDGTEGPGPNPFISFFGGDQTSGSFELIAGLTDHVISFKFGGGLTSPSLFAFYVNGMTYADWQLLPIGEGNALSHVAIYGPPVVVPEPATLAILGLGLMGFGFSARRRKSA